MHRLSGDITQWTVAEQARSISALAADGALDLSAVGRADSSAIALLLAVRRARGDALVLTGIPAQLDQLIDFFGVRAILTTPSAPQS